MLRIAWSPYYAHPLPEGHRFPMEKYDLIPEQLIWEGTINREQLFEPDVLSEAEILLTHTREYWEKLRDQQLDKKEIRRMGFPLSERLIHREINIGKGTLMAARFAMQAGVSMNVSGGTHHAFADRAEGFCLLNDMAMAANCLLATGEVQKILIVDLDVHQGNGTAEIFSKEERVFTFSMHCKENFPMVKTQSDLDLALPEGTGDEVFLHTLRETLPALLEEVQPELVFYLSGVDVLATDKLGRLSLSLEGCRERDRFVFEQMKKNELPVAVAMGGGYSAEIRYIVEAHCNTFRLAQEIYF